MAFVDNSTSFRTVQKLQLSDGGRGVLALVGSGIDGDTPVRVAFLESGYMATALAASLYGYVGVPENGSIASGAVGLIRIEGYVSGVQGSAAAFTGAIGAPVIWAGASLHATSTATALGLANANAGQVGLLTTLKSGSTTAAMFLTGTWTTPSL